MLRYMQLLAFCIVLLAVSANAQNTFPASGNVGIGTKTPLVPLEISGSPALGGSPVDVFKTSSAGGVHIGLLMPTSGNVYGVPQGMLSGFDWLHNVYEGIDVSYSWALGRANAYISQTRSQFPKLPQPSATQIEDIALTYYKQGVQGNDLSNTYWLGNSSGTAWVPNADTNYTEYVDAVRKCHN